MGLLIGVSGCSQKGKPGTSTTTALLHKPTLAFFGDCSHVSTRLDEIWILLCRKESHPSREELYEFSKLFKTFKRLTYQDGVINSLAVRDFENIYYASTYDQSKEQFVQVIKGQEPGSNIYLKKRDSRDFQRITSDPGYVQDLYWSPGTQKLYYVHSQHGTYQLMSLDKKHHLHTLHSSKTSQILSPITLPPSDHPYWIEFSTSQKKYWLYTKVKKKTTPLLTSTARILMIRPDLRGESLFIGFSTGLGGEIWKYNPTTFCWQLQLRTQTRWNAFELINDNEVFLSMDNGGGAQLQNLVKSENTCEPSPPALGVESIK